MLQSRSKNYVNRRRQWCHLLLLISETTFRSARRRRSTCHTCSLSYKLTLTRSQTRVKIQKMSTKKTITPTARKVQTITSRSLTHLFSCLKMQWSFLPTCHHTSFAICPEWISRNSRSPQTPKRWQLQCNCELIASCLLN